MTTETAAMKDAKNAKMYGRMGMAFQRSYLSPIRCPAREIEDAWYDYYPRPSEKALTEYEFTIKHAKKLLSTSKFYITLRKKLGFDKNTIEATNNEYSFCCGYINAIMDEYEKRTVYYSDTAMAHRGCSTYARWD